MVASTVYVAKYVCIICGGCFTDPAELSGEEVPFFRYADGEKIAGNYSIVSCKSCRSKLGRPIKVLHRPYERDLAIFEKAGDPVVLQNSGPKDD